MVGLIVRQYIGKTSNESVVSSVAVIRTKNIEKDNNIERFSETNIEYKTRNIKRKKIQSISI